MAQEFAISREKLFSKAENFDEKAAQALTHEACKENPALAGALKALQKHEDVEEALDRFLACAAAHGFDMLCLGISAPKYTVSSNVRNKLKKIRPRVRNGAAKVFQVEFGSLELEATPYTTHMAAYISGEIDSNSIRKPVGETAEAHKENDPSGDPKKKTKKIAKKQEENLDDILAEFSTVSTSKKKGKK